jgi:hypothetical protein
VTALPSAVLYPADITRASPCPLFHVAPDRLTVRAAAVAVAAPGAATQALTADAPPQVLRVWLDRAVEGTFALTVTTELEMVCWPRERGVGLC